MAEISFTSGIRPVTSKEFSKITAKIDKKHFVGYPWTTKESVLGADVYTTGVVDCTVCGITDGKQALLLHICPSMEQNRHFYDIFRFIVGKLDMKNKNLQGIIMGSKCEKKSSTIYQNFVNFFEQMQIPFSELKQDKYKFDTAYINSKDEWLISSYKVDKLIEKETESIDVLKQLFSEIRISDVDEIV